MASADTTMYRLLIALIVLIVVALLAAGALVVIRHRRRRTAAARLSLPQYDAKRPLSTRSMHRRLNTRPEPDHVSHEKQLFIRSTDCPPPSSPVPEIRITLPDDVDGADRSDSTRVVVVHVGDTTVGFEPYDDKLPYYQESEAGRFESLDLDRIGGLKEKEYS